jgi:integrase
MATIEKRVSHDGEITYRVKVRLKGYPVQTASFTRLTDAKKWEQETEVAIREGKYFKCNEAKKHTLNEMIDRYIKEVMPLKPKSSEEQTRQLHWWKEKIGAYMLADISASLISETRHKLINETIRTVIVKIANTDVKKDVRRSLATVNRYTAALSHVFTIAVKEWEWLEDNPMRKISKFKEPRGRTRFLSDDERKNLLTASKASNNPVLYTIVILALSTGARKMEILGLRWQNIDFKRKVIILHETKNGERRVLPLAGYGFQLLEAHAAKQKSAQNDDFVFPNKFGTAPVEIKKCWDNALRRADITDFRFHDLRHSAASYLAMNDASLAEIAEVLGHKTLAMVKRYAHLSEAHTAKVVGRMNAAIFSGEAL